jgi:hypothetical protein
LKFELLFILWIQSWFGRKKQEKPRNKFHNIQQSVTNTYIQRRRISTERERERESEKPVVGAHLPRAKSVPPLNPYFSFFLGFKIIKFQLHTHTHFNRSVFAGWNTGDGRRGRHLMLFIYLFK